MLFRINLYATPPRLGSHESDIGLVGTTVRDMGKKHDRLEKAYTKNSFFFCIIYVYLSRLCLDYKHGDRGRRLVRPDTQAQWTTSPSCREHGECQALSLSLPSGLE